MDAITKMQQRIAAMRELLASAPLYVARAPLLYGEAPEPPADSDVGRALTAVNRVRP